MEKIIHRPSLDQVVQGTPSVQLAFLRSLIAIAAADGTVNIAEYDQLAAVATKLDGSTFATYSVLRSIDKPDDLKISLTQLKRISGAEPEHERRVLFDLAVPLLVLQGDQGLRFANELGQGLNLDLTDWDIENFQSCAAPTIWKTVTAHSMRRLKGRASIELARKCIRITGSPEVAKLVVDYLEGGTKLAELDSKVNDLLREFRVQLTQFGASIQERSASDEQSLANQQTAELLLGQVNQRLAILKARVDLEKDEFEQEFEEVIHDAGNAFELDVHDRLKSSNWTLEKVWKSIASATFGKELERRVDRLSHRLEARLRLYKEEVRHFSEEYNLVHVNVWKRQHHTQLAPAMPSLRPSSKIKNSTEDIAEVTLVGGTLVGVGTGTAMYIWGVAAVLPVIAPVATFVGGAMLVAGALKWVMDSSGRKDEEIHHKRQAFEYKLRELLGQIRDSYIEQLDVVMDEFTKTARVMVEPVLLEADAMVRVRGLQTKVSQRLISEANASLFRLENQSSE